MLNFMVTAVNKDTQYLSLDTNLGKVTENDNLVASISLNNIN